jgi:hypothetical protein
MPRGIPSSRSSEAKHNPVLTSKALESAEMNIGHTKLKPGNRKGKTARERIGQTELVQVADADVLQDQEKLDMLAFMAELVTVRIAGNRDPNDQIVELIVNGRPVYLRRGVEQTVPRFYVDRLAHLKTTTITTPERVDPSTGERHTAPVPHTALTYEFTVTKDANPLGPSWLAATMAMAG